MNTQWTIAEAIKHARHGQPLREVAARAGVSAAQINRIENGQVQRPSAETLIAIARGLWLSPLPLLILSGHLSEAEARRQLGEVFAEGTEVVLEWGPEADSARAVLADPESPREEIRRIAFDLFSGEPLYETSWDDSFLLLAADAGNETMREVAGLLAALTPERTKRVLDYLRDQVELSRRDLVRADQATTASPAEAADHSDIDNN